MGGDLIMMTRDKNNNFERVENFHADLAWNYPSEETQKNQILHFKLLFQKIHPSCPQKKSLLVISVGRPSNF